MSTSPTALARPSPRTHKRRVAVALTTLAVVAAAVLLTWLSVLLADPDRVTLVVENPTAYDVNVDVRSADGGGSLGLGAVAADSSKSFSLVIDQGERWLFEFSSGGIEATPIEVSRDAVITSPILVPESVEEQFREAGLNPPP